jgi:hypothetical protein
MRTCSVCGGIPAARLDGCCGCESGITTDRRCIRGALLTESADAQWMRILAARLELSGIPCRLERAAAADELAAMMEPVFRRVALFVPEEMLETARRVLLAEIAPC